MSTDRITSRTPMATLTGGVLVIGLALAGCSGGSEWDAPDGGNDAASEEGYAQPGLPDSSDDDRPESLEDSAADRGMTDPAEDALSTFALDIDTGSYTRFRDAITQGGYVDPQEVRTEEFINYFAQDYPTPADGLAVHLDATTLPFDSERLVVRVGIASAPTPSILRDDVDLVLVVDCSGSMSDGGKMETTQGALRTLVSSLRPSDHVAMVCYSTEAEVLLEPTAVSDEGRIMAAIDELRPLGSTNAAAGLELGYDLAAEMRTQGRMTRVILISDGVANVGETDPDGILSRISTEAKSGVNLVSVGVGMDSYNDYLLEQLADTGDGWHVYVDGPAEAERVFSTDLTGSLVVAATDARAQVEFDPAQVAGYRLIGYENRAIADEDFRNDDVDGGEVFAGHTTTALYEVTLREGLSRATFVRATVRYQDDDGRAVERDASLAGTDCTTSLRDASPRLYQDLVIALLTDHLVGGPWSESISLAELQEAAAPLPGALDHDPDVVQLVELIEAIEAIDYY